MAEASPQHEGKLLREYLKKNRINQDDFAGKLGMKTRQGLGFHLRKSELTLDFKSN